MGFILDELFRVSTDVELPGKTIVQVVAIGDLDNRLIEEYALSQSLLFQRQLDDPLSDSYISLIEPFQALSDEALLNQLSQAYETLDAAPAAVRAHPYKFIGERDDATEEDKRSARQEQDAMDKKVDESRQKAISASVQQFRDSLKPLTREQLVARVSEWSKRLYTHARYYDARKWCGIYLSTYLNGTRLFRSADEVQRVPPSIVSLLHASFITVNSKDPWAIEKAVLRKN